MLALVVTDQSRVLPFCLNQTKQVTQSSVSETETKQFEDALLTYAVRLTVIHNQKYKSRIQTFQGKKFTNLI